MLNANYVRASLSDLMSVSFGDRPSMHEALFDDRWLEDSGITTLDFAKAMIDEGFHPMTVYFPLVVHGAMLIEPTEIESSRASTSSSPPCAAWPRPPGPATPPASRRRRASPRAAASTRPRRPVSRGCGGVRPFGSDTSYPSSRKPRARPEVPPNVGTKWSCLRSSRLPALVAGMAPRKGA